MQSMRQLPLLPRGGVANVRELVLVTPGTIPQGTELKTVAQAGVATARRAIPAMLDVRLGTVQPTTELAIVAAGAWRWPAG